MEGLHEVDLKVYCDRQGISQAKYEAALDYLRALITNPEAKPSKPIRRWWDIDLIKEVKELAEDGKRQIKDGFDRIERGLYFELSYFDGTYAWGEIEPAMDYLERLSHDCTATYDAKALSRRTAERVKELSFGYPQLTTAH